MFGNLLKAAVAVAFVPVAAVVDVVTLPASSCEVDRGPFDKTGTLLKAAAQNVEKAVKPD